MLNFFQNKKACYDFSTLRGKIFNKEPDTPFAHTKVNSENFRDTPTFRENPKKRRSMDRIGCSSEGPRFAV